ncbi:unnamed protein product [Owenia fusiformis]|uniref:Androglobin n=1 Tax=Owenia fusiformis TaxID=6347 RepID=A0A8J1TDU3_OWEFU|nr:unnamed protein product [Owenia fusiformis]
MASKQTKKKESSNRVNSAQGKEAASIAASVGATEKARQKVIIWPEWSDTDVNGEKWDGPHKGKEKDKGKSPVVQHYFDDPEGKIDLPSSLKVDTWKRPTDFIEEKTPTVVDIDGCANGFDLVSSNEHIHDSELIRTIISQVSALWQMSKVKVEVTEDGVTTEEVNYTWKPWEHIYAIQKVGKGPYVPSYNSHGKYVVRLYWMGTWRKIIIDDTIPFDDKGNMLLPATRLSHELWPMLLSKALIKVAALDYNGGSANCEFGDVNIIQCLTSWLPEVIPLQYGHMKEVWELLQSSVKKYKQPEPEPEKPEDTEEKNLDPAAQAEQAPVEEEKVVEKPKEPTKPEKPDPKAGKEKGKDKGKGDKGDKKDKDKGDKERDKHKDKSVYGDDGPMPEHPELVVFASYSDHPRYPIRVTALGQMADASERLRQTGLSHMYPHPVLITQSRDCDLEPPPPPEKIPAWKLIRPRKKKPLPTDEPKEEEVVKPIQCLEITSPFVNYKVSPVPIPQDTHRPKSILERGGSRPPTAPVEPVEETDENAPTPEPEKPPTPKLEDVEELPKVEVTVTPPEEATPSKPGTPKGARSPMGKKKGKKGAALDAEEAENNSKSDRKMSVGAMDKPGKLSRKRSASRERTEPAKSDSKEKNKEEAKDSKKEKDGKKGRGKSTSTEMEEVPAPAPSENLEDDPTLGEEEQIEEPEEDPWEGKAREAWIDFDNFVKCFKTLYIYHKTNTYPCNHKYSDLKNVANVGKGDKKDKAAAPPTLDDRNPHYLFVDNLKPTEIVVSLSSFSRWQEPPPPPPSGKEKHSDVNLKDKGKEKTQDTEFTANGSVLEGSNNKEKAVEPVVPGLLVAEPYSWKSLVTGQPILRIRTTATKAAVLSLPEGRHVLRFMINAPLGYHVHLCSSVQFVYGDEETVMPHLTKESCRFIDNATQVILTMGKCIQTFNDPEANSVAREEFAAAHCPYRNDKTMSKTYHHKLFMDSFYGMLRKALADNLSLEMSFAWRAFFFDITTKNILGLHLGSRPATGATSHRGSAKHTNKNKQKEPDKMEYFMNKEYTPEEMVAVVKIQTNFRGYFVRKVKMARTPGNPVHAKTHETLLKAWQVMEPNAEVHGLFLFRNIFKADPDLMPKYPFFKDEWNKISYADYSGIFADQPNNNWFLVFREIFHVTEEMLVVPKLYVPINTCMLRVVNNDTGEEVPRVFQKTAPYVYKKNKRGYTFVAEARTIDHPLASGKWKMRLIGSLSPLPAPIRNEVSCTFHSREIKDYYVPNERNVIFRYTVKVTEDHLASLQMNTSKSDVYIKIQILDHEEEMLSAVGKGHTVLPAFLFLKDYNPDDLLDKRPSSKMSNAGGKNSKLGSNRHRRGSGSSNHGGRASHMSREDLSMLDHAGDEEEDEESRKPHKYIVQAMVLRNSWPLSESSWNFVQQLKEQEKNELKRDFVPQPEVTNKERPPSPPKSDKTTSSKGKEKPGKKSKKDTSRPPSVVFDIGKPHWTIRVISDASQAEEIDVRKDTERADEIRAMKKAWEDAEPGRAAKAQQSRLQYLNSHLVKVDQKESEATVAASSESQIDGSGDLFNSDSTLTLEPPSGPSAKEIIPKIDLTPYLKKTTGKPRLKDEAEIQRQLVARKQEIEEYRAFREGVEEWREKDRIERNELKQKQLQLCEKLQAEMDEARRRINGPREAFRQKFLEAERARLDEIAASEAALHEKAPPSPKGRKSAKGKKSPGGKKKK